MGQDTRVHRPLYSFSPSQTPSTATTTTLPSSPPNPNPNSPSPMTTIVPPPPKSAAQPKKPSNPGQPWSHLETTSLIDAYESKWYSLRRGQLKAQQWEEVAAAVSARCSAAGPATGPPKTGTQCRHKIEKLRKRYRSEKARPVPSLWPYFDLMERLERGPHPVSVKPPVDESDDDDDDEDSAVHGDGGRGERFMSINGIYSGNPILQKRRDFDVDEEEEEDGGGFLTELAAAVRGFGEGMAMVERRRMELARELEREWRETEARRAEMVLESQRRVLESIAAAFETARRKRARREEGS